MNIIEVNQSLQKKTKSLREYLNTHAYVPNYFMIGIDEVRPCFYIYTNIRNNIIDKIPKEWEGIPVEIRVNNNVIRTG